MWFAHRGRTTAAKATIRRSVSNASGDLEAAKQNALIILSERSSLH